MIAMYLSYELVFEAVLLVAGIWWCKEIFDRLKSDVALLKESDDNIRKAVVIFFWLLTIGVIILIVNFVWSIINNIIHAVR
jgi:hypothetical protein